MREIRGAHRSERCVSLRVRTGLEPVVLAHALPAVETVLRLTLLP